MSNIRQTSSQLMSLMNDNELKFEFKAYKSALTRLRIRLRNNVLISHLKKIKRIIYQLHINYPSKLINTYRGQVQESIDEKKRNNANKLFLKFISQMILFLDSSLDTMLQVYCITESHFKIGHLIHHLIVIRTCISRLRICFKALLVYSSDLLLDLIANHKSKTKNCLKLEEIQEILIKNECKPRVENIEILERESTSQEMQPPAKRLCNEKIGVLIDRASYRK